MCHECAHPKALAAQSGEKTLARAEQLAAAQSELLTELGATPVPLHPRLAPTLHPAEDHAPPALPPAPLPLAEAATAVAAASTKDDGQHADAHTGAETAETSAAVARACSTLQDEGVERRGASDFTPGTTAVVVLACKRSEYLKQTMNSLLELNGIDKYNVIIDAIFGFSFGTRVRTSTEMLCSPRNSVPIYHQWWTMLFSGPSTGTI